MTVADALTREMGNKGFRFIGSDGTGLRYQGMGNDKVVTIVINEKSEADIPALVKDAEARVLNGRVIENR